MQLLVWLSIGTKNRVWPPFLETPWGHLGLWLGLHRNCFPCPQPPVDRGRPFSLRASRDSLYCSTNLRSCWSLSRGEGKLRYYFRENCSRKCFGCGQSGTGSNKNSDAGTSSVPEKEDPVRYLNAPVPDWDTGCQNADAGGIDLDADA
jgi:hypothetical protein